MGQGGGSWRWGGLEQAEGAALEECPEPESPLPFIPLPVPEPLAWVREAGRRASREARGPVSREVSGNTKGCL